MQRCLWKQSVDAEKKSKPFLTPWLKNVGGFDPGGVVDAANNVFDALDEIAGVGLRNMIKILVWDGAGNVTERKISERSTTGREQRITVVGDHNVIQTAGQDMEQRGESLPEKRKSILMWDLIIGVIIGLSVSFIINITGLLCRTRKK